LFRTGHGRNDYGYSNPLYDTMLDQISSERIPSRRRRLMEEAERVLMEDMPLVPVYTYVTKRLVDQRLKGWDSNVMDHHYSKNMYMLKTYTSASDTTPTQEAGE
jgi:oligopeptide transport system substrate-binding protein